MAFEDLPTGRRRQDEAGTETDMIELPLTNGTSHAAPAPPSADRVAGGCLSNTLAADGSPPSKSGPFAAFLGSCDREQNASDGASEHPPEGHAGSLRQERHENHPHSVEEELHRNHPVPVLGADGSGLAAEEGASVDCSGEGGWIPSGLVQEQEGRNEPAVVEGGAPEQCLLGVEEAAASPAAGTADLCNGASEGGSGKTASSPQHRVDRDGGGPGCDRAPRSGDAGADETVAEGAPSKAGEGSPEGEPREAGPRTLPSRNELPKGMEQPGDRVGGEMRLPGQTAPGETVGPLAGKEAATWRQEAQMDPPSKPSPPPSASHQAMPAQATHASSRTAFRIQGDSVHMRIQDEELGPMRWHLQLNGGRITAEAIVETSRIQEILQNHQDALQARMNDIGEEIESFDVSVDQGSQQFSASSEPGGSGRGRRSQEGVRKAGDPEPVVWTLPQGEGTGLDLYA